MAKLVAKQAFSVSDLFIPNQSSFGIFDFVTTSGVTLGGPEGMATFIGNFNSNRDDDSITRITFSDASENQIATFSNLGGLTENDLEATFRGNAAKVVSKLLSGNDTITLSSGRDIVKAYGGNDRVDGKAGNDVLNGMGGRDLLDGGSGNDRLTGGGGNDRLTGGTGKDILKGSAGADVFVFADGDSATNNRRDVIRDFQSGTDSIDLSGVVDSDADFIRGRVFSGDGNAEINYRSSVLWVDQDGDGTADLSVRIANGSSISLGDLDF